MTPVIHYIVRFSYFDYKSPDLIEFKFYEKEFKNAEPIKARKEAFQWFENYSHISLLKRGLNESNADRLTGKDLQNYFQELEANPSKSIGDTMSEWALTNPDISDKLTSYGHPELILVIDDENLLDEEKQKHQLFIINKELSIYKIINLKDPYDISDYMLHLDQEYAIYKYFNYETENLEQKIDFFDPEIYNEGAIGEKILDSHIVLNTPFDWDGYEKPLWWMSEEEIDVTIDELNQEVEVEKTNTSPYDTLSSETHEEIITKGEGHMIEFKPCLFAHVKKRNIQREIFNVICSFLNSSGGFIYLGVNDKSTPIGVNLTDQDKDHYKLEFTNLKEVYFDNGVTASNIKGDFVNINGMEIFWIQVEPSFFEPVFLVINRKGYNDTVSKTHHFYLRQEASTHEARDPKILIEYVKNHWYSKQQKR